MRLGPVSPLPLRPGTDVQHTGSVPDLPRTLDHLNEISLGHLPGFMGIEVLLAEPGRLTARMAIRQELMAPNGYLHAASVIALADTACGYGTMVDLPAGNTGFTTIELKTNFVGTSRQRALRCEATR